MLQRVARRQMRDVFLCARVLPIQIAAIGQEHLFAEARISHRDPLAFHFELDILKTQFVTELLGLLPISPLIRQGSG
jgi:hypothetical protein